MSRLDWGADERTTPVLPRPETGAERVRRDSDELLGVTMVQISRPRRIVERWIAFICGSLVTLAVVWLYWYSL